MKYAAEQEKAEVALRGGQGATSTITKCHFDKTLLFILFGSFLKFICFDF